VNKSKVSPKIAALNARMARVKQSPEVMDWMKHHSVNDPKTTLQLRTLSQPIKKR